MRFRWSFVLLALALGLNAATVQAQEEPSVAEPTAAAEPEKTPEAPKGPEDPLGRGVPRSAMQGYLTACREGDFETAAGYLDLRRLPAGRAGREGPNLARQLKVVLDQTLWVETESLSDEPLGDSEDGLPAYRERVGSIETAAGRIDILLQHVPREDGVQIWKFSSATVEKIPALYDEFGYGPIEEYLPDWVLGIAFLEVALWQWLALLILIVIAAVFSWVLAAFFVLLAGPIARRTSTDFDNRLLAAAAGPLRLLIAIGLFAAGSALIGLSLSAQRFLGALESALVILAVTWLLLRLVNIFTLVLVGRLRAGGQTAGVAMVPLGQKAVKAVVVGFAFIAFLDSVGINVTALLAGLGVGGIAVALAAQKTVENLFGGVTLLADRPVGVGDFCRFGDRVGVVEDVGLRSTRVRTLDRTVVSVSNAEFSAMQLENFAARDKIWYHPRIGLRYETTPDQIRHVLVEVRKMLYAHPKVLSDPARIRFVQLGDYSIDLDVFAYVDVTDYGEYLEVAEDLNLRIMDIVEASGTGFAFPSQTLYVGKDTPPDPSRARAAEQEVDAWRQREELYLPKFPKEKVDELKGTLTYPEPGSPDSPTRG